MIKRKINMIVRKLWRSDHFLTDEEIKMYDFLLTQMWLAEPRLNLKKKQLLEKTVNWLEILKSLEKKRRIKDLFVFRTKISLVLILKPPAIFIPHEKTTY